MRDVLHSDQPSATAATAATVVRANGERLAVHLLARAGDEVDVALDHIPARPVAADELAGMALELITPGGVVRMQGARPIGELGALRFSVSNAVDSVQHRDYVRVPAWCPVEATVLDGGARFRARSIDLSGGGMLLAAPPTLAIAVGERISFRLTTAENRPPVNGTGVVVRIGADGELAIEIEQISEGDRRRLVRFLFECQRLERRRGVEGRRRGE